MGSGQNIKNFKKCLLNQDNSILFERFMICRDTPTHGWVMGGSMGGVRLND